MNKNKTLKIILLVVIIPLIAEVFIFNFRFWESLFFKDAGDYTVTRQADEILLSEIDAPVRNIRIDCSGCDINKDAVGLYLTLSDEANTELELSHTEVVPGVMESNYIRIYPDGNVRSIKITFDTDAVSDLSGINVELNARRPFCVHPARFLAIAVLVALICLFRPGSVIYQMPLLDSNVELSYGQMSRRNKIYSGVAIVLLTGLMVFLIRSFTRDIFVYYINHLVEGIYTYQSEAILDGHVYLNFDPPSYLSEMANPYDNNARLEMYEKTGEAFLMDFAFFDGKYYSYYGIVPTLLFYLPFVALTGMPLSNSVPIAIFGFLFIVFSFLFIFKLVRRYYSGISFGIYLLLNLIFITAAGVLYCFQTPHIYSVAFISAMTFTLIALYNWFSASDKHFRDSLAPLSVGRLLVGAVAMGLAIGCRPVYGLYLFLLFPLFASEIKERLFFSRKGLVNTLCVMLPMALIGAGLLYFNKLRFGSLFDFGNNYNLSQTDLEYSGMGVRKLWLGIFEYLFQPMSIKGSFPYVESIYGFENSSIDYQGYVFFDPVYAGYFALCPISLAIVFLKRCKKTLADMKMYYFCILSLIFVCILLFVDIEKGGITQRYQMDFGMLIDFVVVLILIALFKMSEGFAYKNAFKVLLFAVIVFGGLSVFNNFIIMLAEDKQNALIYVNPRMFYSIKYLLFALR